MNSKNFEHHKFKHSLGQNFIIDEFLLEDIADLSGINKESLVLEIAPGNGALTRCLSERAKKVVAVEIDKSLIPLLKSNLKEYTNVKIINADFMNIDFSEILNAFDEENIKNIEVVANLPYYITSPIIMKNLLNPYISKMTIMVQKEVAERITSKENGKEYGVLTIACRYFADVEPLILVSKVNFYPVPKVDSEVIKFTKHEKFIDISNEENFNIEENEEYKKLFKLVKAAFSQRRKKLSNSLCNTLSIDKEVIKEAFNKMGFNENIRAEEVSIKDYMELSKILL